MGIEIYKSKIKTKELIIKINKKQLPYIVYPYKIIKEYTVKEIIEKLNKISIIYFCLFLISVANITKLILNIEIKSNNKNIINKIENTLEKNNITKITFRKSDNKLNKIKETILNDNKEVIEWINIERKGMKYIIELEEKKNKNIKETKEYCNIHAQKSGIISRIIPEKGAVIKEQNDYVEKGDIIISGDIIYNDEIKKQVCADGKVYSKMWYTINISIPKKYLTKIRTNKQRSNIVIKYNNKTKKIFKSRVNNPESDYYKILNFFNMELYYTKEYESKKEEKNYNKEELNNLISEKIKEKIKQINPNNLTILEEKVLKKTENNSTIEEEIFIVAEEEIGIKE